PGADTHQVPHRRELGGIEQLPTTAEEGLEYRVKIGRRLGVARVTGDKSGRNVQRAAKGDREMREIAADAGAQSEDIARRVARSRCPDQVVDVGAYPSADRVDARIARREPAEQPAREIEDFLGLAVLAAAKADERVDRQRGNRNFRRLRVRFDRGHVDHRQIPRSERTGRHIDANEAIERLRLAQLVPEQRRLELHPLFDDALAIVVRNGHIEDEDRLRRDLVFELAIYLKRAHRFSDCDRAEDERAGFASCAAPVLWPAPHPSLIRWNAAGSLDPSHQQQYDEDDDDQSCDTAGSVAPPAAVWPRRQRAQ